MMFNRNGIKFMYVGYMPVPPNRKRLSIIKINDYIESQIDSGLAIRRALL